MKKVLVTALCALALMLLLVLPASAITEECYVDVTFKCGGVTVLTKADQHAVFSGDTATLSFADLMAPGGALEGYTCLVAAVTSSTSNASAVCNSNSITLSFPAGESGTDSDNAVTVALGMSRATFRLTATSYTAPVDETVELDDFAEADIKTADNIIPRRAIR